MESEYRHRILYEKILELVYELDDGKIDNLLSALHQDLGREGMLFCEVCNNDAHLNFGPKADKNFPVSEFVTDAIQERKERKDQDHLRDVVGSLMIAQFKGENKQDQYRAVINAIFAEVSQDGGQK